MLISLLEDKIENENAWKISVEQSMPKDTKREWSVSDNSSISSSSSSSTPRPQSHFKDDEIFQILNNLAVKQNLPIS